MPPPVTAEPFEIVRWSMVAVTPGETWKIRYPAVTKVLRAMLTPLVPPAIVVGPLVSVSESEPLVSVTTPKPAWNATVSAPGEELARVIAAREPAPLSPQWVTRNVARSRRASRQSRVGLKRPVGGEMRRNHGEFAAWMASSES